MAWFRRRTSTPEIVDLTTPAVVDTDDAAPEPAAAMPAIPSATVLARTERALVLLASQSARLQTTVVRLEHRVDVISGVLLDKLDAASTEDLADARLETAKVASELARLEINLAARLEAVRDEIRAVTGEDDLDGTIDLRPLRPTDTGWQPNPARSA